MGTNILHVFMQEPQPIDFVWDGFKARTIGALVSPGGVGKSFFALEAAIAIAGGPDLLDLRPQCTGRVVYLDAENPQSDIIYRLHAIGQYLNEEQKKIVAPNLIIEPIVESEFNLMRKDHLEQIIEICTDSRLLILDTISCFHTKDENNSSHVARLISALKYIITQTGTTILFLHRTNKPTESPTLINNTRWCGFLREMTEQEADELSDNIYYRKPIGEEKRKFYLRLDIIKSNYAIPSNEGWFVREEGGVLIPTAIIPAIPQMLRSWEDE